jgi:hypothetical protein
MDLREALRNADIRGKMTAERTHNSRGGSRDMRRARTVIVGALWAVAALLMGVDVVDGGHEMGLLGLLVGMAAVTCTITTAMRHNRRVILEVMTWELWMRQSMDNEEGGDDLGNVRAIR